LACGAGSGGACAPHLTPVRATFAPRHTPVRAICAPLLTPLCAILAPALTPLHPGRLGLSLWARQQGDRRYESKSARQSQK